MLKEAFLSRSFVEKGTPAGKKSSTAGGGGGDYYQVYISKNHDAYMNYLCHTDSSYMHHLEIYTVTDCPK